MIRGLIGERTDPVLFALSHDYVGDLSETVALMWPAHPGKQPSSAPSLSEVVETLSTLGKSHLPAQIARWLDGLDETGRWALLKLVTGGLRIGGSARLAKTATALIRAHAAEDPDLAALPSTDFMAEWKWDGIRVQAVAGGSDHGGLVTRLYSRTGEEISKSFPDLLEALCLPCAIDGELLIMRDRRVQSFNVLQQRLNRKAVTPKLLAEFPADRRAYDLLAEGDQDLRGLPLAERRERLEKLVAKLHDPRIDVSPLIPFRTWDDLAAARADPATAGAGQDAGAVEGVMLKRRDAPYVPGRPKGLW